MKQHYSDPESYYNAYVSNGSIADDPVQRKVLERLQSLHGEIRDDSSALLGFLKKKPQIQGIYIWGDVGRGKSMLMDMFYVSSAAEKKRRVHFHAFMVEVHARIHQWRQENREHLKSKDPLPILAKAIAEETNLLCFDEFQVSDVADAMILERLFTALFDEGVWMVMTSNRPPESLYLSGLQRDRFLKFIDVICTRMEVLDLAGKTDYRLQQLRALENVYVHPLGSKADDFIHTVVAQITHNSPSEIRAIEVQGRNILAKECYGGLVKFSFSALCGEALGALDYLTIAKEFHTLVLTDIPLLTPEMRNEAKRFVTLIDALYEHKVKLVATAAAVPDKLYAKGDGSFEFARTASRLIEMQSEKYLSSSHIA